MAKRSATGRWGDHWTDRAKAEGFSARSAYKLDEIERKMRVLPRSGRVLDLGCSPGSWTEYVKRKRPKCRMVGVDIQETGAYAGHFIQADILELPTQVILDALDGPADLVLSDMAPNTTGARLTDHVAQLRLATMALSVARQVLAPGGSFVVKVFDGEDAQAFTLAVRKCFTKAKRVRPEATRDQSVEFFFVATGFKAEARLARTLDTEAGDT